MGKKKVKVTWEEVDMSQRVPNFKFIISPKEFKCVCDLTNNPPSQLETGKIKLELYLKYYPTMDHIKIEGEFDLRADNQTGETLCATEDIFQVTKVSHCVSQDPQLVKTTGKIRVRR